MRRYTHHHIVEQVPIDYYQKGIDTNLLQRIWHTNKLKMILEIIPNSPKKILDVGCASGWFLSRLSRNFPLAKCSGIDIYDSGINYGKRLYPHLRLKVADAHNIPYRDNTFDLVICTEVIEHVDDPLKVLVEMRRVLKKGGYACIEVDSGSALFSIAWYLWRMSKGKVWSNSHIHSFDIEKLEQMLLQAEFKIIKKREFNVGMAMVFLAIKDG